jgi:hypothetical protein
MKAGRKPLCQSRGEEFRQRLSAWKSSVLSRPSLRALARELGTSHQLLGSYLKGLNNWQEKQYRRRAEGIREIAATENRDLMPWEESQAKALDRAAIRCLLDSALASAYKQYEAEFQGKRSLTKSELAFLRALARQGVSFAQKLLQKRPPLGKAIRPMSRSVSF